MLGKYQRLSVMFILSLGFGIWAGSSLFRGHQLDAPGNLFINTVFAQNETAVPGKNPHPGIMDAPSFEGGNGWLNTAGDIKLADLKGKIVLVDFWTYCCINCMHILPDLEYLEEKYPNQLVVVGCHSAKFKNEKDSEAIRQAIMRYEIKHPVINDSDMVVWDKFNVSAWPTLVVIDPQGKYVGYLSGEGKREVLDQIVSNMITYHRAQGTLDETPLKFKLESEKVQPGPLRFPGKILIDEPNNRLFIADSNHNRIIMTDLEGKLLNTIGNGSIGKVDGDFMSASFFRPQGMELVQNKLYVADTENHLIRVIDLTTSKVSTLAGTGKQARSFGVGGALNTTALNSPWDITHVNGVLYIAMAGPHQLWNHEIGTDQITVFAGTGREDILDGHPDDCALAQPSGIVHIGNTLYFVDSEGSALRKLNLDGKPEVTTIAGPHDLARGRSLFEFADIDGVGDKVRFQHPIGLGTDGKILYVCDSYNHKIRKVDPITREVTSFLGTGKAGLELNPVQFSEPAGMAISKGIMYLADTNNHRILRIDLATKQASLFEIKGLSPPKPIQLSKTPIEIKRTNVAEMSVNKQGDQLVVEIEAILPEGFKLNNLATPLLTYSETGESKLLSSEKAGKRLAATVLDQKITIQIPISALGATTLNIDLNYQYCRNGNGGICKVGTTGWTIPLTILDQASSNVLKLSVKAP